LIFNQHLQAYAYSAATCRMCLYWFNPNALSYRVSAFFERARICAVLRSKR
jgi:hypothetical protein